ncbi:MAG: GtrA family protein [Candidatus Vogelbacteria bacterium]|nr:GtrA family protein [Candidatus Vogelbacteria bacterium]
MTDDLLEQLSRHKIVLKYIAIGILSSFIDVSVLFVLKTYFNIWYLLAAAIAFGCSFAIGFVFQKYWTFRDVSVKKLSGQVINYLFTVLISFSVNMGVIYILVETFNPFELWYVVAQIIAVTIAGIVGFILNVRSVFHDAPDNSGVVIATGIFPPDIGGPATFVHNLGERLIEKSVKVTIVTYSDVAKDALDDLAYQVIRISRALPFGLRHFEYLVWLFLATVNHGLIYAQDITAAGVPALLVKKILRKRMIMRIGGDLLWERSAESGRTELSMNDFYKSGLHRNKLIFMVGKKILANCEKIFVTADNLRRIYIKYYDVFPDKIEVLHNPLPSLKDFPVFMANDKAEHPEKIILFAGRFVKYKNIHKLIDAFLNIYDDIKPARLVLIGDGPEVKKLRVKIRNEAGSRVEIINKLPHKELFAHVGNASLCVSAATTEYNPNFILECLSLGKKVLLKEDNGLTVNLPSHFLFKDGKELEVKMKNLLLNDVDTNLERGEVLKSREVNSWESITLRHMDLLKSFGLL